MDWLKDDLLAILQIGVIGLGFLLAVLAYHLLTKEQKQSTPRPDFLKSIYNFMCFSVVLCVIGIAAQLIDKYLPSPPTPAKITIPETKEDKTLDGQNGTKHPQKENAESTEITENTLYNYFTYSVDKQDIQVCNISEFVYSEKSSKMDTTSIEGDITGTILNKDFENHAFGYKNGYYLKIVHEKGVGFLKHTPSGDYTGCWINEPYDPEVLAVICPVVYSPGAKGLSAEEARNRWPILDNSCLVLNSLDSLIESSGKPAIE